MHALDDVLADAVAAGHTPGIVAAVATREGLVYTGAAGQRAIGGGAAMTTDTVFRAYSMTKAVGAVAAAKVIEDGGFTFDTPVEDIVPAFGELQVLDGFDGEQPVLRPPATKATIRHLVSHTSGLVYEFWNANQARFLEVTGAPNMLTGNRAALHAYPLAFDPGTQWDYGVGIDWLGQAVEAVVGERIDAYCRRVLFEPLGMTSTDFEVSDALRPRLCEAYAAGSDGFRRIDMAPPAAPEVYGMGHALYSTGPDYLRFLRMLLGGGALDGVRVLEPRTTAMLLENQIGELEVTRMTSLVPVISADIDFFPEQRRAFSCVGLINTQDVDGKRRAGSHGWAGVLNTHYWIDPAAGIAALFMLQHIPFVDPRCLAVYDAFERAVYREVNA